MTRIYLSVIIPAYNEEKRLPKTLIEIDKYLSRQDYSYEIIVVDNGSTDRTVDVVESLTSEVKNLKIIAQKVNRGKGYAIRQGMLQSKGDYKLFTDADNSTSIDQVEKVWPEFKNGYDIVVGSRDIKGAVLDPPQPLNRRLLGKGFRLLTHLFCGTWEILDTQCGFKGFTRQVAKDVFLRCKIDGFSFDSEVLTVAKMLGYKIKEIPVYWKNDPESKVKLRNVVKMGLDLLKIRWNLINKTYSYGNK